MVFDLCKIPVLAECMLFPLIVSSYMCNVAAFHLHLLMKVLLTSAAEKALAIQLKVIG